MRLICPNCDAQYEIDERVIPDAGRDVQCSNCGHAWFQHPEGFKEPAEMPGLSANQVKDEPEPKPEPEPEGQDTQAALDALFQKESATDKDPDPQPDTNETSDTEKEGPQRRGLDEDVRDVLREEASRETRARHGSTQTLETQPELGLPESPSGHELRGIAAQERMARLRGLDVEEKPSNSKKVARRDLLPDVEEINSSLAPISNNKIIDDFADPTPRKNGFRRGFLMMLILAAIVAALYVYAPLIGEKVPALVPYLESYVGLIDKGREWLDDLIKLALTKL